MLDYRIAVEVGAVVLAAERRSADDIARLREDVEDMRDVVNFSTFRRSDIFFHLGIAEAAQSARLVAAMTEVQGEMSELIAHIAHHRAQLGVYLRILGVPIPGSYGPSADEPMPMR